MKKCPVKQVVMFSTLCLFFISAAFSQARMGSETRYILKVLSNEYQVSKGRSDQWKQYMEMYPLYAHEGGYSLSLVARVEDSFRKNDFIKEGVEIGSRTGSIVTLRVPAEKLSSFLNIPGLAYLEVAGKVSPLLDKVVYDTRVDSIHKGINLPQPFTGKDVIIGITDWGFDYTHPVFYDTTLTHNRILAAWDQYKKSGPAPSGYTYGTEFSDSAQLLTAQCDTANIYSYALHGTHVGGIAAGSGGGIKYRGMAFESEYLMVTIRVDVASVLDAFNWMKSKADAEGKRLVINMSWGLYFIGTMDGNSLISQAIDQLSADGVVFCNSAGNNGDANFHIKKDFNADTLKTRVNFYSYTDPSTWGQSVQMWGEFGQSFQCKYVIMNAANAVVAETPLFNTLVDTNFVDTFLMAGTDTIFYKLEMDAAHPQNGKPHARFMIRNRFSTYKVALFAYADSGTVHCWNVTVHNWNEGNWGIDFTSLGAGYTVGDNQYGISEPAVTQSLITVASHNAEFKNPAGVLVGGLGSSFSSVGPTIDGRMKPDVSAPGGNVCSSISSYTDNSFVQTAVVNFNSRNYPFARLSGTSMSSPAAAGVCALMLDANPFLTPQQVKDILIATAREDSKTGDLPDSGSTRWGHGKVNAYAAILMALNTVNINSYTQSPLLVYPNPVQSVLNIYSGEMEEEDLVLNIFSVDGKQVKSVAYRWNQQVDVSVLPVGLYVLTIAGKNVLYHTKFTKTN